MSSNGKLKDTKIADIAINLISDNQPELLSDVLSKINDIDVDDGIILHSAIESRNLDMVKIVVEHGADVDTIKADHSPLTLALSIGEKDIANYLIVQGADVNYNQDAAITYAIQDQDWDLVKNLAKHGADLTVERGMAFSQAACYAPDELPGLIQAAQEMSPSQQRHKDFLEKALNSTIIESNNQAAKALIEHGADVDEALINNIINRNNQVAEKLIDLGAEPTKNNDNPLYVAVNMSNYEMINHLIVDRNMPISNETKGYLKSKTNGQDTSTNNDTPISINQSQGNTFKSATINTTNNSISVQADKEPYAYALQLIEKRELNNKLNENLQKEQPSFSMSKPRQSSSKKMKSQGMKL